MQKSPHIIAEQKRIGANIRRERVARCITQEKLAEAADLNPKTVQKIEAGTTNIFVTTAIRLQRAIKCPWEKLLD